MERIFKKFIEFLNDDDFKKFKSDFSLKIYDCLSSGYAEHDNEVSLVTKMSENINKTKYKDIAFYSKKIHGSRSYVEFNYRDKPTTKELADMIIISSISNGKNRIFQKTAFIQNKKDINYSWQIDPEQLFLLKNFPKIIGKKGIFKKSPNNDIIFQNYSKTLGNYGLFMNPGEMFLVAASIIDSQKERNEISIKDLKNIVQISTNNNYSFPFLPLDIYPFIEEFVHHYHKFFRHYGYIPTLGNPFPFLNNILISRDIFEFIDNWSFLNIGEPTMVNGKILNKNLHSLSNSIMRVAGFNEYLSIDDDDTQFAINNNLIVSLMNINIGE